MSLMNEASAAMSPSVEDYLRAIWRGARGAGAPVSTSVLSATLGVAPASVSGMLRRLSAMGLLDHVPYHGVRLTDRGSHAALRVVRRHRILERYLADRLGYGWESVHAEADRLEHAASDELIERMALVLGDPAFDPHGAPIPTRDGTVPESRLTPLSEIPVGASSEVRMVDDRDPELLKYLTSLGLTVGAPFRVLDRQPFDGPITVEVPGASPVVVGYGVAAVLECAPPRAQPDRHRAEG
jgi:DtxR family Mn-dependent transcriptional regulator